MENNDQATVIEFKTPSPELDFYKEIGWLLESSPLRLNRDVVLEYVDILVSDLVHDHRATGERGQT